MADFPENENQQLENEEFSTVFADPMAHKEVKTKSKKLLPKILAGVLALAVLIGGTVAVVKLIPVFEEEEESVSTPETITVKEIDTDDVATVSVTNSGGTLGFYSETETAESDTESETEETVSWYIKQIDKDLTDSSAIEYCLGYLTEISSTRKITEKTAEECGFSSPNVTAVVNLKDGSAYTVLIGDKSPDNSGYYLKLEDEDIIYLVSENIYAALEFEALDFADTSVIAGFDSEENEDSDCFSDDGTLISFDRLTVSGKNYPETIEIVPNDYEEISEYYAFIVKSPQKRLASTDVEQVLSLFQSGITPSGAYSYEVTSASLKNFGLDQPDVMLKMEVGSSSITYKMSLQSDGNYAVISDSSRLIYMVAYSSLSTVAEYETTDYYLPTIFLTNISTISNFTVNAGEKSYSFDIEKNEDEGAEEDYTITINGEKLVAENFQNFYANCVSIQTKDYINDNLTSSPDVSFVMTLKEGGTSTVEFTKVSNTRYQCKLDGVGMGRVTASDLDYIIKLAEKTANGETITF